ncbi:MAG: hypothetical protein ACE5KH_01845 [Candidatus Geothermarchaeales archaeon]
MAERIAVDPVCKMEVDEDTAEWKTGHGGKTCYIGAPGCKLMFGTNPSKWLWSFAATRESWGLNLRGCPSV